jgi:rod shape-determining protein MreC
MPQPGYRRTGYSRRAQYKTFFAYVGGVLGLAAGGALLFTAYGAPERFVPLRNAVADMTAPVGRAATSARNSLANAWDNVAGYATWGPENARLKREVSLARVMAVKAQATAQENTRLKALLKLNSEAPGAVANGWLVAASNTSTRRYATISAGAAQGVAPGMPVRSALGLVGRVLEVGHVSARVLLVTDTESVVPVRRASDGLPAFVAGRADGSVQIRLITLAINPLHPGDVFVTSGSGGLYWPGTPIAVVSQLTRDGALGRVLGDPGASELVEVQPAFAPTQDATLPPPSDETKPVVPKPKAKGKPKPKAKHA